MSSSRYWELTVGAPADLSEGLTNLVWELGALGVVEEEQPGRAPRLRAFFPETARASVLEQSVRDYLDGLRELGFAPARDSDVSVVALADENWHEAWRVHFTPQRVGRRLVIAPPWETPAAGSRLVITIEPGRAFGTGHHGSTLGCLEAVEAAVEAEGPRRMIDLGTGSGILAIAAARLGVDGVLAVDDDRTFLEHDIIVFAPVDHVELGAGDDDIEMVGMHDEPGLQGSLADMEESLAADPYFAVGAILPAGGIADPAVGVHGHLGAIGQLPVEKLAIAAPDLGSAGKEGFGDEEPGGKKH